MIFINDGLTADERQKVERPYARNCREGVFDYTRAGDAIASFVDTHQAAFIKVGEMLDRVQTVYKEQN